MYYKQDEPYGACGVNHVYDFEATKGLYDYDHSPISAVDLGKAKLVMAAFVKGNAICDKAYLELTGKFNLVYESSWRRNTNTNNMFKLCIFDGKKKKNAVLC